MESVGSDGAPGVGAHWGDAGLSRTTKLKSIFLCGTFCLKVGYLTHLQTAPNPTSRTGEAQKIRRKNRQSIPKKRFTVKAGMNFAL
jgi:hypothetical protein